jgi:DNA-binding NarL/FixJ family response regulator
MPFSGVSLSLAELEHRKMSIIRILLVDDFVPWHAAVKSLLKANPELQVKYTATNGLEAIGKAQQFQPDLVLLDIGLPGINGIEAAAHILSVSPGTKIIFLSNNDCRAIQEKAVSMGATSFVGKSVAVYELLSAVETVVKDCANKMSPVPIQITEYC